MTRKLLLFDFDGVIADSFEIFFHEFTTACTELGFKKLNSKESFLNLFEGNLLFSLIKAGFPPWKLRELFQRFQPRISTANAKVRAFEKIPEVLNRLAGMHLVYIISSNLTEAVRNFLIRESINSVQDILGADIEPSKVKKIKSVRLKHPTLPVYYIGDTAGDVREGREAGAITVAVSWGWHDLTRLQNAKPDFLVQHPEDLLQLFGDADE